MKHNPPQKKPSKFKNFRSFHSIREYPDYEVESQKGIFVIWSLAIDDGFTHELCSQKSAANFMELQNKQLYEYNVYVFTDILNKINMRKTEFRHIDT